MKASAVYLKAAKFIDAGTDLHSCCAIIRAAEWRNGCWTDFVRPYADLFGPHEIALKNTGYWLCSAGISMAELREWRITALCLMACIARDSERGEGEAK